MAVDWTEFEPAEPPKAATDWSQFEPVESKPERVPVDWEKVSGKDLRPISNVALGRVNWPQHPVAGAAVNLGAGLVEGVSQPENLLFLNPVTAPAMGAYYGITGLAQMPKAIQDLRANWGKMNTQQRLEGLGGLGLNTALSGLALSIPAAKIRSVIKERYGVEVTPDEATQIQQQRNQNAISQGQKQTGSVSEHPENAPRGVQTGPGDRNRPAESGAGAEAAEQIKSWDLFDVTFNPKENRYDIRPINSPKEGVSFIDPTTKRIYFGSTHGDIWGAVWTNEKRKLISNDKLSGFYKEGQFVDRTAQRNPVPLEPQTAKAKTTPPEAPPEIGPGAASPSDVGTKPQIQQLSEAFKNIEGKPVSPAQKVAEMYNAAGKISAAKDAVSRAVEGLKTVGDWFKAKAIGAPFLDDMLRAKGELSAEVQMRGSLIREATKDVKRGMPSRRERAAVAKWVDAGGDLERLKQGAAETKPEFRQAYEDAQNLSGDALKAAQNIRNYFDSRLDEAIDAGALEEGVTDYIHRIYEFSPERERKALAYVQSGILNDHPALAKKRVFQFDWEAEKAGLRPVQDFLPRVLTYEASLSKAIAARRFIQKMVGTDKLDGIKAPDGRPVIDVAGIGTPIDKPEGVRATTLVKPSVKKGDRSDYVHRDYSALRKWKWATNDAAGKPIMVQGDLIIHPDFVRRIDALLKPSQVRYGSFPRLGRAALAIGSGIKQTMLDLSGFHQVQVTVHALEHRTFGPVGKIDFENPKIQGLLRGGVTLGGDYYGMAGEGLVGRSVSRLIPGLGDLLESYHSYLFQDYIPRLKMAMALHALERNISRYGKKFSPEQIYRLTANQANAAFGELNYITLERSKTAQDFSRLLLLAPDFLEARGRFAGQALTKFGAEQRQALLLGALTLWVTARISNKALDDQWHMEPENLFSVVHKGRAYSLRTVQGDLLHLVEKPVQFWMSRLNPAYGRTFLEMAIGRDYFGRKRSVMEQIWDAASTAIPISLRTSRERSLWESMANAFGITARRWSDVDKAMQLAQDWKKSNGIVSPGEFIYDGNKDPLRPLKISLSFQDEGGTAKEIKRLLDSKAYDRHKMWEYFNRYATAPFTGSRANDRKFVAGLTEDQKKTVIAARQHREAMRKLFRKALSQYDAAKASLPASDNPPGNR